MRGDRKGHADNALHRWLATPLAAQTARALGLWLKMQRSWPVAPSMRKYARSVREASRHAQKSPLVAGWRGAFSTWRKRPWSGIVVLLAGNGLITLLVLLSRQWFPLPNLGAAYIPLIAMLAYYWGWSLGIVGCALQLLSVYLLVLPPGVGFKPLHPQTAVQLLVLAAISVYVLLLVQLARSRRDTAVHEAARFAALNTVGTALVGELHEDQLLHLIARTACDLTGADFAAFTLRPVDALGWPLGPAEGSRFHLAAAVGVTPEQEAIFRRIPLGGEGLLAPIYRQGVTVRVDDTLAYYPVGNRAASHPSNAPTHTDTRAESEHIERLISPRDAARQQAFAYAHGAATVDDLRAVGMPHGHPIARSFLGAPLLDREGNVRGGLLLGHNEPERFTKDDESLLKALAAQAAVTIENARLYRNAQAQAGELSAVFESIADGVMVYDHQCNLIHENNAASGIRSLLPPAPGAPKDNPSMSEALSYLGLDGEGDGVSDQRGREDHGTPTSLTLMDKHGEVREYAVSVSPLQQMPDDEDLVAPIQARDHQEPGLRGNRDGTVVVWHEVTETRKLLAEQQAHAEVEARRTLLQRVIDEQPSGVYLVRGRDAKLALANHAAQELWGAQWAEGQPMADFLASSGVQIVGRGGHPLDVSELATVRTVRNGEAVRHFEEVIRRPDGASLPVLLNAVALDPRMLESTQGTPMLSVGQGSGLRSMPERVALVVLQDFTAIKEAERLKDEFITIAAHELKTPMAAVKGYAEMLVRQARREGSSALEPWQMEALETIDQATNRLVELTEDLLDVARLQAERLQLHTEPHDLIALARRVMKRFQLVSDRHVLTLVAEEEFVVAQLDVRRTEQIVGNLLSNAIKYSPEGGSVTIAIEQDEQARSATLSVRDKGIGIPASQQAILFNRFTRADNARERGITGTGLGLYLCRELAELQSGQLWFTSEEGQGSAFFLTLPLADDSQ